MGGRAIFSKRKANPGEGAKFLMFAASAVTDECIMWPFGVMSGGYGICQFEGVIMTANAALCELVYGPKPKDKDAAAHKCGARLCVNPKHLYWASRSENELDKRKHGTDPRGTSHGNNFLSEEQVIKIFKDPRIHREIAADYGIARRYVCKIKHGGVWGWLTKDAENA